MENVSTGVLDKNKEYYSRCKDKDANSYDVIKHIQLHKSKFKKWRFIIHHVQPTAQLLFKVDFQKVDKHTGGKWLIHDQTPQGQSVAKPETPLPNILVE